MDTQTVDVEGLRAKLKAMSRAETRRIALAAGLACSTVEKFRGGHITEPGAFKVQALLTAIASCERQESANTRKAKAKV